MGGVKKKSVADTSRSLYEGFVDSVISGKRVSNDLVRKTCERYVADLDRTDIWFDHEEACKHIDYLKLMPLVTDEYAGKLIDLMPWQAFYFANTYGWKRETEDGIARRFKKTYLQIPRKNGKTTVSGMAAIGNAVVDKNMGSEILFAAISRDQAGICFKFSKDMCSDMSIRYPSFGRNVSLFANSIEFKNSRTFLFPVSSDANNIEGKGAKCAIIDEVHVHRNSAVIRSVQKGMVKHLSPLIMLITTAGYDKSEEAPAWEMYNYSHKILNKDLTDDTFFPFIFELDPEDDWNDESNWGKANPNIGKSPKWTNIRDEYQTAVNQGGSAEVDFKIKHLNMWVDSATTWISKETWKRSQRPYPHLIGQKAYGGLDLASVRDMCSICVNIPYEGLTYFIWKYYLPEKALQDKKNPMVVNYRLWQQQGFLTVTPGDATDYAWIKRDLLQFAQDYDLVATTYDRHNSSQTVVELINEGLNMLPMGQGFQSMSPPTKQFESDVLKGKIQHGDNPITDWQMGNVRIVRNETDDIKVSKGKSNYKVDGIVAAVMSLECENVMKNVATDAGMWIF